MSKFNFYFYYYQSGADYSAGISTIRPSGSVVDCGELLFDSNIGGYFYSSDYAADKRVCKLHIRYSDAEAPTLREISIRNGAVWCGDGAKTPWNGTVINGKRFNSLCVLSKISSNPVAQMSILEYGIYHNRE